MLTFDLIICTLVFLVMLQSVHLRSEQYSAAARPAGCKQSCLLPSLLRASYVTLEAPPPAWLSRTSYV